MREFTVYGGCISRDVFNYLDPKEYIPKLTIGQNPISSMFEQPFEIELDDYKIGKNFEKRMLYFDSNKLAIDKILEAPTEYFIFDVICERITLMEFQKEDKKGIVEKSWDFVNNWYELLKMEKYKGLKKVRDIETFDLFGNGYEEKIEKFCKIISGKYKTENIIFLELQLAEQYIDKQRDLYRFNSGGGYNLISKFNNPSYANKVIAKVQKLIKMYLPDIHYIPMPYNILADTEHHFGLHPLHYMENYYLYAAKAIEILINEKKEVSDTLISHLCKLQEENNDLLIRRMCRKEKDYSD